jgi:hypothetical protein
MKHRTAAALVALLAPPVTAAAVGAQSLVVRGGERAAPPLGGVDEDRGRVAQILGRDSLDGFLLRSASTRAGAGPSADASGDTLVVAPWWPELAVVRNSALPFSLNDGALWAGRGTSVSVTGGLRMRYRMLRVNVAPTYVYSENAAFALPTDPRYFNPVPPVPRSPYSYPWRFSGASIDLPLRFGATAYRRLDLGQSAAYATLGAVDVGFSSENEWWGPGVRNALLMSNNAPGIPRLFVRTARPLRTPVGVVEARYMLGSLSTSEFFETVTAPNRGRSLSAAAVTLRPRVAPTLTLGFARSVFAQTGDGETINHLLDVLGSTGRPNALAGGDPTQRAGRDQLYSFFARYVIPDAGFESYVEWGRAEMPVSVRDFLVSPNHTQGYTLGVQYARPVARTGLTARLQAEFTNVAQSNTFNQRPSGSWYTSRAAIQGYTQRGQVIGAAIGPGGSSQWLATDVIGARWTAGLFATRIRWDDDAHYTVQNPLGGFCRHDVSLLGGVRGSGRVAGLGSVTAAVAAGNRLNLFYQNARACFSDVGPRVDRRNVTLSFGVTPSGL